MLILIILKSVSLIGFMDLCGIMDLGWKLFVFACDGHKNP